MISHPGKSGSLSFLDEDVAELSLKTRTNDVRVMTHMLTLHLTLKAMVQCMFICFMNNKSGHCFPLNLDY